ncbi:MAG: hypothetical protein FWC43_03885 [Planctomycetaceae bacterium]|nr:hypothetical protein [Planctomycetaceae bacterium]
MKNLNPLPALTNNSFVLVVAIVLLLVFSFAAGVTLVDAAPQEETTETVLLQEEAAEPEEVAEAKTEEAKPEETPAVESKAEEVKPEETKTEETPKEEPKKEEPKPAPESVELKYEPLRLTVKLPGMFEAKEPKLIQLKAEEFNDFKIVEFVKHGQKVNEGETLIRFDSKKYDEALAEKEKAFRLSEMSLEEEILSLKNLEDKTPLFLEAMMLAKRYSDEDFAYYYNVLEAMNDKMREFFFKLSQFFVELAREELRQLEKMYASDDLVEETEEIILKRTRMMLEYEEMYLERSKISYDREKEVNKARADVARKQLARLEEIDFQKAKELFPQTLEKAKIALERKKVQFEKEKETLQKFRDDKKWLTIRAPSSGVVYYGEYKEGKWNGASQIYGQLKIDENVKKETVLMSIVEARPSLLRVGVPEKELHWVKVGTEGKVVPTSNPDLKFGVRISELNDFPGVTGEYVAMMNVDVRESKIVPNMSGNVEFVVYDKKEAILVPNSALKRVEEEEDSDTHGYVFLLKENNETEKVKVKTGKTKGEKTEILEGVSVGQKILKTAEKATQP